MSMSKFNPSKEEIGEFEDKPVEINLSEKNYPNLKLIHMHSGTTKYHTHLVRPERKTELFAGEKNHFTIT